MSFVYNRILWHFQKKKKKVYLAREERNTKHIIRTKLQSRDILYVRLQRAPIKIDPKIVLNSETELFKQYTQYWCTYCLVFVHEYRVCSFCSRCLSSVLTTLQVKFFAPRHQQKNKKTYKLKSDEQIKKLCGYATLQSVNLWSGLILNGFEAHCRITGTNFPRSQKHRLLRTFTSVCRQTKTRLQSLWTFHTKDIHPYHFSHFSHLS